MGLVKLNSNPYKINSIWDFVNHKFYSDTLLLNIQESMVYVQKGYLKHSKFWKKTPANTQVIAKAFWTSLQLTFFCANLPLS
tara:strand:+ start:254 stop:499 length:246 start_codon:yes stop_codon:yes gene_type:complete